MNESTREKECIQLPSEKLTQRLLSLETEYQTIHDSALKDVDGQISFKPDVQTTVKLTQMLREGADLLRQLEPLLNTVDSTVLNGWKRDKWVIDRFDQEMNRQDAFARKRPPAPETSQQEPRTKAPKKIESTGSKLKRLGIP